MPASDDQADTTGRTADLQQEADTQAQKSEQLFEDDPVLGRFLAYYPSNRVMLLLRAGAAYIIPVLLLQVLFANLDDATASALLIGSFTLLALGVGWYITHLWNREIVLYEHGFTYREGSRAVPFLFQQIVRVHLRAERIRLFGAWQRDVYEYLLTSDEDEQLKLNNIYKNISELGLRLERAITRARKPIVQAQMQRGEQAVFSADFILSAEGIRYEERFLPWAAFVDYTLEAGYIDVLTQSKDNGPKDPDERDVWAHVPLKTLDNEMLLVELLKERRNIRVKTAQYKQ